MKSLTMPEFFSDRDADVLHRIIREVLSARAKFPDSTASMTALTEEVGELAKAMLEEPWQRVVAEAVQVAAMAIRVATEGDSALTETRRARIGARFKKGDLKGDGADAGLGPRCPYLGCSDPVNARPPCALCYE